MCVDINNDPKTKLKMSPKSTTCATIQPDTRSRYSAAAGSTFDALKEITADEVPGLVEELRSTFRSEKTQSVKWRKEQLRNFGRMIDECQKEFCEGMFEDLHKSPFEGYLTELGLVKNEIETALEHLDSWMIPEKKSNSALNIPCWSTTQRDPLGVVLIMGAWNYPVQLALAPMVGAIAGGNCILMKPGSYSPATSNILARIIPEYLDQDAIRVIEGNRDVTSAVLKERFEKIFFTGSGFVGRIVARAAAEHMTPCVLELGGKSPCVVDSSADLEHASQRLCWGTFLNGGQTCVRPDFCLVHEDVADAFFKQMQKTLLSFYGENPQETEWFGRCINESAFTRLAQLVEENKQYIVTGGKMDKADKFISPTVLDFGSDIDLFRNSSVMQDEIFGPLLPCFRYKNIEDAVSMIKDLPTGKPLALYAFGSDATFIKTIKTRTTSGGLCINDCLMHLANHDLPFGGVGSSGMGSYHGKYSFDCFTHEKAVLEKSQLLDQSVLFKPLLGVRFPPYNKQKKFLVKTFALHIMEKLVNVPIPLARVLAKILALYAFMTLLGFKIVR